MLGGLFVLKSSICACHVVHLIGGVLYSDCPLIEILLYNDDHDCALCNTPVCTIVVINKTYYIYGNSVDVLVQ